MGEREGPKNQETWGQLLLWLEQSCTETLLVTYRVGVKGAHVGSTICPFYCFPLCTAEMPSDNLKEVWQVGGASSCHGHLQQMQCLRIAPSAAVGAVPVHCNAPSTTLPLQLQFSTCPSCLLLSLQAQGWGQLLHFWCAELD